MNKCEGGIEIDSGPCRKCGAWPSDRCGFPLPDPELASLRAENEKLRAESTAQAEQISELQKDRERLETLHAPMVTFIDRVVEGVLSGYDLDGVDLQEMLVSEGLLNLVTMEAPCHKELCNCADIDADFPTKCYRIIPEFIEARKALKALAGEE